MHRRVGERLLGRSPRPNGPRISCGDLAACAVSYVPLDPKIRSARGRGHRIGDQRWFKSCPKLKVRGKLMTYCYDPRHEIGSTHVNVIYLFEADRLESVNFDFNSNDYLQVVEAFQAKFGPPDSVWTSEWQNSLGAKFENNHVRWLDPGGVLAFTRLGHRIDSGLGILMSVAGAEASAKEAEAEAQRAKKDL